MNNMKQENRNAAYVKLSGGIVELPTLEEAELWAETYDAELCSQSIVDKLTYPVSDSLGHPMYAMPYDY